MPQELPTSFAWTIHRVNEKPQQQYYKRFGAYMSGSLEYIYIYIYGRLSTYIYIQYIYTVYIYTPEKGEASLCKESAGEALGGIRRGRHDRPTVTGGGAGAPRSHCL